MGLWLLSVTIDCTKKMAHFSSEGKFNYEIRGRKRYWVRMVPAKLRLVVTVVFWADRNYLERLVERLSDPVRRQIHYKKV